MANGFLQNSFKLGTPARGGGDLLSAFLGINTNPDVQLKGQLAGARLGNLDSRTRRSNILGQQDAIELSDMQELRDQFVKGTPERQAVIDPRFHSGQKGLAVRTDRLNKEDSLATLAESGFTMPITGADGQTHNMLLSDAIKMMSGADFKAFVTANPEVKNLLSKANTRDAESLLRQTLLGKQTETEGERKKLVTEQIKGEEYATEWEESRRDMAKHSLAYAKKTEGLKILKERGELQKLSLQINKLGKEVHLNDYEIGLLPRNDLDKLIATLQALKDLNKADFDRGDYIKLFAGRLDDNIRTWKLTNRRAITDEDLEAIYKATEITILAAFESADTKRPNLDPNAKQNSTEALVASLGPELRKALEVIMGGGQQGATAPGAPPQDVDLLAEADALQGQLQPGDVAPVQPQDSGPAASGVPSDEAALLSSLGLDGGGARELASGILPPANIQFQNEGQTVQGTLGGVNPPQGDPNERLLDSFIGQQDPVGRAEANLQTPAVQPQVTTPITVGQDASRIGVNPNDKVGVGPDFASDQFQQKAASVLSDAGFTSQSTLLIMQLLVGGDAAEIERVMAGLPPEKARVLQGLIAGSI